MTDAPPAPDSTAGLAASTAAAQPPPRLPSVQPTTLRDLAPWAVLSAVVLAGVVAKSLGADVAVYQLLGTVAGVCGGYVAGRKSGEGPTVTTTGGDPSVTQVKS